MVINISTLQAQPQITRNMIREFAADFHKNIYEVTKSDELFRSVICLDSTPVNFYKPNMTKIVINNFLNSTFKSFKTLGFCDFHSFSSQTPALTQRTGEGKIEEKGWSLAQDVTEKERRNLEEMISAIDKLKRTEFRRSVTNISHAIFIGAFNIASIAIIAKSKFDFSILPNLVSIIGLNSLLAHRLKVLTEDYNQKEIESFIVLAARGDDILRARNNEGVINKVKNWFLNNFGG